MSTPVNVIGGFLGVGKTTAVLELVRHHGGRVAVIVNDFGEAGIDAVALGSGASVRNIPGGCVCCTAPEGLAPAVLSLLDEVHPDHILIEPSGLARPQDIVDMLSRGPVAARIAVGPTVLLVDPSRGPEGPVEAEQWEAADVIVANRTDLATAEQMAGFRARVAARWPAPRRVLETTWGALPVDVLSGPPPAGDHDHHHEPSTSGYEASSRVLDRGVVLDWRRVSALLGGEVERFKGLLHTDIGWVRVDVAGGRLEVRPTPWRTDSRWDVIARAGAAGLSAGLAAALSVTAGGDVLEIDGVSGDSLRLTRTALAALPGQILDVGTVVPGRAGQAVPLAEVLALVGPAAGSVFVVRAADGLTAAPAPVASAGEAVLVHSLGGEALPGSQGGPFRLLVRPGGSACANVKGVAQIRVVAG